MGERERPIWTHTEHMEWGRRMYRSGFATAFWLFVAALCLWWAFRGRLW